jgi:hypothetical protein
MNLVSISRLAACVIGLGIAVNTYAVDSPALPTASKPNIVSSIAQHIAQAKAKTRMSTKDESTIYGPYWVQFDPNYCNIAKVYLQGSQIFGTEVGCSDTLGLTYAATVDAVSNNVYLSAPGMTDGTAGIWQVSLSDSTAWMSVTTLDSNNTITPSLLGPYNAQISLSQPAGAAY